MGEFREEFDRGVEVKTPRPKNRVLALGANEVIEFFGDGAACTMHTFEDNFDYLIKGDFFKALGKQVVTCSRCVISLATSLKNELTLEQLADVMALFYKRLPRKCRIKIECLGNESVEKCKLYIILGNAGS